MNKDYLKQKIVHERKRIKQTYFIVLVSPILISLYQFSQTYNDQYWFVIVLYGLILTKLYFDMEKIRVYIDELTELLNE